MKKNMRLLISLAFAFCALLLFISIWNLTHPTEDYIGASQDFRFFKKTDRIE